MFGNKQCGKCTVMTQDISDRKGEERVTGSTDKNEKPEEKAKERRDATPTKVCGEI